MFFFSRSTRTTHDVTTPHELTVAFFLHVFHSRLVTPPAAKERTPVDTLAGEIADATSRTKDV